MFKTVYPKSIKNCLKWPIEVAYLSRRKFALRLPLFAVQCYTILAADESIKTRLFKASNQRSVFVHAELQVAEQSSLFTSISSVKYSAGHCNFTWIVESAFNCFAKNQLKRINDRKLVDPPAKMSRTIRKLTGKS